MSGNLGLCQRQLGVVSERIDWVATLEVHGCRRSLGISISITLARPSKAKTLITYATNSVLMWVRSVFRHKCSKKSRSRKGLSRHQLENQVLT